MSNKFKLYEGFHTKTKHTKRIPKEGNFTYKHIFKLINYVINKKSKILDIGCGAGIISLYCSGKVNKVVGIDISKRAIQSCENSKKELSLQNIEFIQGDVESQKVTSKYDIVIMSEIIEHIKNDDRFLKKVNKLLNNGGTIIITTPSSNAPLYKLGLLKKFDKRVGHYRRYSIPEIKKLVKRNKFKVVKIEKQEGIIRNVLFNFKIFSFIVRIANKYEIIGNIITYIDKISMKLFGESDIQLIAVKQ